MKKYKRWILVLTALTAFYIEQVGSLKATSLTGRFSKLNNSSTASTTTAIPSRKSLASKDNLKEILDELPDDDSTVEVNGTKITLTGIPQIDYVWDPNLPRELNGFNLSTYPFLDSMPADEDIGFDCEDKINGFYASIKYSCQLYHHCLYGVRSNFICANFTAFDQKTFICHFVSEVDCKNSQRYWSRNDDLYKATTVKNAPAPASSPALVPLFDRGFYNRTRHAFLNGVSSSSPQNNGNNANNSPATTSQTNNHDSPNNHNKSSSGNNNNNNNDDFERPMRPLRRPPYRRRRPVDYYYYDDEEYADEAYDERGRRRNRPRNRRPLYDDYDTRPRPDNRRPYYDDFDDYEYERRPMRNRNRNDERRRGYEDRRSGGGVAGGVVGGNDRRRPSQYYDDDKRPAIDERKRNVERKPPTLSQQQAPSEERKFPSDGEDRRGESRRRNNYELDEKTAKPNTGEIVGDEKLIKPQGSSIFDRTRPPPKISRPVPLREKSKFAYNKNSDKPSSTKDDYYDEVLLPSSTTTTSTPKPLSLTSPKPFFQKTKPVASTTSTSTTTQEPEYYDDEYYYDTVTPILQSESTSITSRDGSSLNNRNRNENYGSTMTTTTTAASSPDSFRLNRYKASNGDSVQQQASFIADQSTTRKPPQDTNDFYNQGIVNKKFANKQTFFDQVTPETSRANAAQQQTQNLFHNLYNNRNLENKNSKEEEVVFDDKELRMSVRVIKRPFLPSRGGDPYKSRGLQPVGILAQEEAVDSVGNLDNRKVTLEDLYNEEYDVDLNDALNPMLKPLTSSRGISGHNTNQPIVNPHDKDVLKAKSQISDQQNVAESAPAASVDPSEQPEYYDDELEYTYADEAA